MHYFKNFKGFKDSKLELFKQLTILIGPNGSGKTNVIEAVELLSFLVHGRPLYEIVDIGKWRGVLEIRGGIKKCPIYGHNSFDLEFSGMIRFGGKDEYFHYSITVGTSPMPRIIFEFLIVGDNVPIFVTILDQRNGTSGDITVEYNNFARGGRKPKVSVSADRSVISQYERFAKKNLKHEECLGVVNGIMRYLQASFVFDPSPKLMRAYERIGDNTLSRDGANLSAVLHSLKEGDNKSIESLNRILKWIKQIPEEPFDEIDFVTTELNDVIFGFRDYKKNLFVDARLISDGTLRTLAVLTALETVKPNSRVVIEEFDNGLHPSRVHVLLEAMAYCCKHKKLNLLVTTHNPATLNSLNTEQYDGVVICAWESDKECFNLIKLSDLPRYDELFERGRLGDLVTKRVVEQYLVPKFEEKHKQKSINWLRNLS